ncbi:hypothetical protein BAE44_0010115 [Dichanthelium oligosanthes]|uniref:Uncharacterized protein n=1 Tax=Dichanthelium oligosanthes TaxID=888268 RepID=A0A1E5VUQ4_9POAL|nr:hypothetical protein BAE44_0010115 [Dichanthelium oligosanthes]
MLDSRVERRHHLSPVECESVVDT